MFSLNVYQKNQTIGENTYQITSAYKIFVNDFELSGYFDLTKADFTTQNQFLYDIGKYIHVEENSLKSGIEWHHFNSKDNNEKGDTFQLLIKFAW
jgi:hypothetical protein